MTTSTKIDYTDLPRDADADDVRRAAAKLLDAAGYLVTDTHGRASDPATYWGENRWQPTPFQCADTDGDRIAGWLENQGGGEQDTIDISEVTGDDVAVSLPADVSDLDADDIHRALALARWAKENDIETDDMEGFVSALRSRAEELNNAADELE
jgi:hypothetical protein